LFKPYLGLLQRFSVLEGIPARAEIRMPSLYTRLATTTLLCCAAAAQAGTSLPETATLPQIGPLPYSAVQPDVVLPWFNGVANFNIGSNLNCITGTVETRVAGYTGFTYLPPDRTPSVGEVFYTHVVLSHPGNPCAGSAVGLELALPNGVQTAASAADPAFCFARTSDSSSGGPRLINLGNDTAYGCPQTFTPSANGLRVAAPRGGIGGGAWGMARGFWLEILIPLRATAPQNGTGQITWTVNPDIGVFGQVRVAPLVNNDVLFRSALEGQVVTLDICGVTPTAQGC
jgi:hypothetical protein